MNSFLNDSYGIFAKIEDCQADTAKKQYQHKLDSICYRLE